MEIYANSPDERSKKKMTKPFEPFKPDLSKVSKAVKQFVADIAKTEGNKKKIDSDNEYNKLSQYLAGTGFSMSKDEIGYVQGLMIEYQNKKFDESITENTKKEVSKIAKRMGNKKNIDTDEEAQALLLMLRNSHRDLNAADMAYIKNLLITSGYEHYLNEIPQQVNIVNVIINDNENSKDDSTKNCEPEKELPKGEKKELPNDKTPVKKYRPKPKHKIEEKTPQKEPEKTKPEIAVEDRIEGLGLADRVVHELNSHIADNNVIRDSLSKVNSKNAYSFVGKFISAANRGINDGVFSVRDLFNKLTYKDTVHVMTQLLRQAADIGLSDTPEYKELEFCIKSAERKIHAEFNADPDDYEIKADDKAIKALYVRMSKEFK